VVQRSTTERVASVLTVTVEGVFYRHAAPNRDAFAGGRSGRWGANFPVIYLGRPEAATAEAYRHLVDHTGVPARAVRPRTLYTVRVAVQRVLDLTVPDDLQRVGLHADDLVTEIDDYDRCQEVAAAAHQLGYHGVLAPAAHGLGQTLAVFRERISHRELPAIERQIVWNGLPPDPRLPRGLPTRRERGA
jgi:RES domain-containing protein